MLYLFNMEAQMPINKIKRIFQEKLLPLLKDIFQTVLLINKNNSLLIFFLIYTITNQKIIIVQLFYFILKLKM